MTTKKTKDGELSEILAALEWHREHNYDALKAEVAAHLANSPVLRAESTCESLDTDAQNDVTHSLGAVSKVAR